MATKLAVVGAGLMGAGIAQVAAAAGHEVALPVDRLQLVGAGGAADPGRRRDRGSHQHYGDCYEERALQELPPSRNG